MAKKMTCQKDVKQARELLEELSKNTSKQTLGEVLHVFLTSIANEILRNHHFLVTLKIAMNPQHSQTHGPLEAPPRFRTCHKLGRLRRRWGAQRCVNRWDSRHIAVTSARLNPLDFWSFLSINAGSWSPVLSSFTNLLDLVGSGTPIDENQQKHTTATTAMLGILCLGIFWGEFTRQWASGVSLWVAFHPHESKRLLGLGLGPLQTGTL